MATAEERKRILKLIQEGKITAEEGAKLLNALGSSDRNSKRRPTPAQRSGKTARWVRVRVTDVATGKTKTTVNIPLGLIDWGLQIGAQYAPEVGGLDLNQLSEMLDEGTMGKIVDVINEEDGEHVEIYVE
ncbi:MAG: hypothetical protein MUO64_12820 [Anaerolineales bacterium]|jgi:hypothetical protein|nr:hypothetical protein [Anaerolineales bacterium]